MKSINQSRKLANFFIKKQVFYFQTQKIVPHVQLIENRNQSFLTNLQDKENLNKNDIVNAIRVLNQTHNNETNHVNTVVNKLGNLNEFNEYDLRILMSFVLRNRVNNQKLNESIRHRYNQIRQENGVSDEDFNKYLENLDSKNFMKHYPAASKFWVKIWQWRQCAMNSLSKLLRISLK